jgi:hypothetical protein
MSACKFYLPYFQISCILFRVLKLLMCGQR